MDIQKNELRKGKRTNVHPNRYNLRSKKKEGKHDLSHHPTRTKNPIKGVAASRK
jgi:hypothetical protein